MIGRCCAPGSGSSARSLTNQLSTVSADPKFCQAPPKRSDADIDALIRATALDVHHPLGTCRMGPASDPTSVVDAELRVHGVEALRVVDASVFPDIVGGNINAPVVMMAEKAADLIRGRIPLATGARCQAEGRARRQAFPQRRRACRRCHAPFDRGVLPCERATGSRRPETLEHSQKQTAWNSHHRRGSECNRR